MNLIDPIRVLVVDDTVVYRKIVSDTIAALPGTEVVGTAHNGKAALTKIRSLKPDLITLDIEMPEMDGIEVLENLQVSSTDIGIIMLSTLTRAGGDLTMRALELGAFDFVTKPESGGMAENQRKLKTAIAPMIRAFARKREIRQILKGKAGTAPSPPAGIVPIRRTAGPASRRTRKSEIVAIGISTGGPNALAQMMPGLPADLRVPVLIVQHMPPVFTQSLAKSLDGKCAIRVREAIDGEPLEPGTALIAPGGKQMKIEAGGDGLTRVVKITDDPPESNCKPSADYLFRSVARHYVGRATGVIMTGMGSDGFASLKLMKRNGAAIIAQDEASCVVFGMPKAPVEAGIVDVISPLEKIAGEILKTVKPSP